MSTPIEKIFVVFLNQVEDDGLALAPEEIQMKTMTRYLRGATIKFDTCEKDLTIVSEDDGVSGYIKADLTEREIEILALGMVCRWLQRIVNSEDNLIKFNKIGYYKITIMINASIKTTPNNFNPDTDFVSYGFRQTNTDNIYVGASKWIYNNEYSNVISQGIVAIDSTDNDYEIVNIGSKEIYLLSPDLNNIKSNSYFTNTLVNIVIEYLGK